MIVQSVVEPMDNFTALSRTHGRVVHGARDTGVSQAQAIVKWTADNAGSDTVPGTTDMTTWGVS